MNLIKLFKNVNQFSKRQNLITKWLIRYAVGMLFVAAVLLLFSGSIWVTSLCPEAIPYFATFVLLSAVGLCWYKFVEWAIDNG